MQAVSDPHSPPQTESVLSVDSLSVEYATESASVKAVRDVSIHIEPGETLGIAGESGSGKSTLALAILRYLGENGRITDGEVRYDGDSLLELSEGKLREIRGDDIAHVPQDPNTSLNPSMTVGDQVAEVITTHRDVSRAEALDQTYDVFREVNLPDPEANASQYPHELSGGQKQRVLLAIALACRPRLLILDEPTTGLDVTTQAKILDLIDDLIENRNTSVLLITHNLGVINQIADRVGIMYAGEILESGPTDSVFSNPANPYTQGLLAALPQSNDRELKPIPGQIADLRSIPDGCIFADRCEFARGECRSGSIPLEPVEGDEDHLSRCVRSEHALANPIAADETRRTTAATEDPSTLIEVTDVKKHYGEQSLLDRFLDGEPPVKAVDGVSFRVSEAESLGIVGESGCGKSTLGSLLLNLKSPTAGEVAFEGTTFEEMDESDWRRFRSECQVVFQNPHSSLNPKHTVGQAIKRPLDMFTDMDSDEKRNRVADLLDQVGLHPDYAKRYPEDLSGGEKQRVAIARAFSVNPSFVVLDEPVSALDVSIQASILNLLKELQAEYGTSYLLISHDFSVVNYLSDRIAVMYLGEFVEVGPTDSVFDPPYHPYTRALLSNILTTDPSERTAQTHLEGDVPSARDPPSGCSFHTRCPQKIGDVCERDEPVLDGTDTDHDHHRIACHLDREEMVPEEDLV